MGLAVLFALPCLPREGLARQTYQVRPGDTLTVISGRVGVTPEALKKANNLKSNLIKPKQILTIPAGQTGNPSESAPASPSAKETHRVKPGDTLSGISLKTGVPLAQLREINRIEGHRLRVGQILRLRKTADVPAAAAGPEETARLGVNPEQEEEEGDGSLPSEEAWGEIERRMRENAVLLGQWSTPEEPLLLVKVATGFLGAPYRLGGSSVTGLDCSAFVKKIYDIFSITLPRTAFEQSRVGLSVPRSDLAVGDLIFFNTRRAFGHVGIYIGNNEFVHASSLNRKVRVDNLDTPYFDKRFVRAVRLKGANAGL
jgi:cell wall-associated NlpC family hydrolase